MNAGLFDWMKGKLGAVLNIINQMEADGTLQQWATQIGQTIQTALTNIWTFGKGVWEIISQVSRSLSVAADYTGGWKNLSMILAGIAFAPTLISTAAGLVQIARGSIPTFGSHCSMSPTKCRNRENHAQR
jgi:phage tail tape-measure protein